MILDIGIYSHLTRAETINLKTGDVFKGEIIEQNEDYVKLKTEYDIIVTYYLDEIEDIEKSSKIPTGTVVAFALDSCPEGWIAFKEGNGRMIVGAGPHLKGGNKDAEGKNLSQYEIEFVQKKPKYTTGGEEKVKLKIKHMPSHSHEIMVWQRNYSGDRTSFDSRIMDDTKYTKRKTLARGGNQPHNNMPPYIALYFCKKD